MGVAGLLRTVIEKYPNVISPAPNPKIPVHYLYLDFNSFIYNAVHAFPSNIVYNFSDEEQTKKYEEKLVEIVIEETIRLVNKVVKPSKLVYIAIDGPPPLAKMMHQRERRYKKPMIDRILKEKDPSLVIEGQNYDTNRITPGTYMMNLLNKEFEKAIADKKFKNVAVVFDGSNIPGEAEHKYNTIIDELLDDPKENHVIFSADGDVIFLSLKYPKKNIYIMQGVANSHALSKFYKKTQEFAYLDVKKLGDSYYNLYGLQQFAGKNKTNQEKNLLKILLKNSECQLNNKSNDKLGKVQFLIDFVVLSFIEGNDFVKPIYFIKFNQDRMRTPLGIYKFQRKIRNDSNFRLINNDFSINQTFLHAIFKRLGQIENERFTEIKNNIEKKISFTPRKNANNSFEDKPFTNQDHLLHSEYVKQYTELFGDMSNFKKNYYKYFFGENYDVDSLCENYLKIILFNVNYYFGLGTSWNTAFPWSVAPLPSDLANYLETNPGFFQNLKLEEGSPVTPFVLLAFVLPPQSMTKGTIPEKYRDKLLKEYPEYFPEKYDLQLMQPGGKLIYAEPHLENPNIDILESALKKIKLTKEQKERNELKKNPSIFITK